MRMYPTAAVFASLSVPSTLDAKFQAQPKCKKKLGTAQACPAVTPKNHPLDSAKTLIKTTASGCRKVAGRRLTFSPPARPTPTLKRSQKANQGGAELTAAAAGPRGWESRG